MRKLDEGLIKEIVRLRREGYSYKMIARKLSISPATSFKYSNGIIKTVGRKHLRKPIKESKDIGIEKIKVIGHCLFDGSVDKGRITYTNSSSYLINDFIHCMRKTYGIEPDKVLKMTNWTEIIYYNTNAVENLSKYLPTFSTKERTADIPPWLFSLEKEKIQAFLQTFWEDEGYITVKGEIQGKLKSKRIIKKLIKLHKLVGIRCGFFVDNHDQAYGLRLILKKNNIEKFFKFVGFRYSIVTKGKFRGLFKRDALISIYPFLILTA